MSLESAYWAIAFKDWDYAIALIQRAMALGKQRLPAGARPYTATHHPHRAFGTVGNTDDTSRDAHAM